MKSHLSLFSFRLSIDRSRLPRRVRATVGRALALLGLLCSPLGAEVKLASPFTSHMVLQQGTAVPVWGTANAGENVSVEFAGEKKSVVAAKDGRWRIELGQMKASAESRTFVVSGSSTATPLRLEDVLVGEVWLASGQSNMAFPVSKKVASYAGLANEEQEIAAANYPLVRMFTAASVKSYEPKDHVGGTWEVCSPATVPAFSAMGYLFARDLHQQLSVPVGILTVAYGASTAEAWIPREPLLADPKLARLVTALDASVRFFREQPNALADDAPPAPRTINARPRKAGEKQRDPVQDQHYATVLYNGMLAPMIPYAIRGAIWYQGESICGGTPGVDLYGHVMKTLVSDWRREWKQGDFPFYFVQLPGQENVSNSPRIREQQMAVLDLPKTGAAIAIDTGEAKNVHPHNKAPVAARLAGMALADVYGRKGESRSPTFDRLRIKGGEARVTFSHAKEGLAAKGETLKGFQVAGADQKFVDATARIDHDTVIVSSPQVTQTVAVRYAWDNFPEGKGCNLTSKSGLPAAPFRTDTWNYPMEGIVEN